MFEWVIINCLVVGSCVGNTIQSQGLHWSAKNTNWCSESLKCTHGVWIGVMALCFDFEVILQLWYDFLGSKGVIHWTCMLIVKCVVALPFSLLRQWCFCMKVDKEYLQWYFFNIFIIHECQIVWWSISCQLEIGKRGDPLVLSWLLSCSASKLDS